MLVCSRLGASRTLIVEAGKADIHTRIMLNVGMDDLVFALKMDEVINKMLE